MQIDLAELKSSEIYFLLTQTAIPRPIAWVLSENSDGHYNLAPFSFFTALTSAPPLLMVSIGNRPEGGPKDTRANILEREKFVVHIASVDQLDAVNESSAPLPKDESELERLALPLQEMEGFSLPRIADCPVAFACRRYQIIEIGHAPQALIIGEIEQLYVSDELTGEDTKGRLKVDAKRLDPLCRLGASEYAALGDIIELARPKS